MEKEAEEKWGYTSYVFLSHVIYCHRALIIILLYLHNLTSQQHCLLIVHSNGNFDKNFLLEEYVQTQVMFATRFHVIRCRKCHVIWRRKCQLLNSVQAVTDSGKNFRTQKSSKDFVFHTIRRVFEYNKVFICSFPVDAKSEKQMNRRDCVKTDKKLLYNSLSAQ